MFLRPDGETEWLRWESHPWYKASGDVGGIILFTEVITERKKAEDQIIKERNLSDSLINSLPGVFYLYTNEGHFIRWNKNFTKITGYNDDELSQMHPLDFFEGDDKQLLAEKINNVFVSGEDAVEAGFLLKTGIQIPYYFTGRSIEYEDKTCLMGVGIDISDRVKAQEEIKQTTEQLRQLTAHLQKIREEERKRIAREIHDELGQQLTAVKMDVVWIDKKTLDATSPVKQKLNNIISLLDSSNLSIRKILNELRMGILDHYNVIEALRLQGRQFSDNTGIMLEFEAPDAEFQADEMVATCLYRVYQEALTNITRYANAKKVTTKLWQDEQAVYLQVIDDGQGFDAAILKSTRSFGVLGMKERVASLQGNFKLKTEPGKGTRITISLPAKTLST